DGRVSAVPPLKIFVAQDGHHRQRRRGWRPTGSRRSSAARSRWGCRLGQTIRVVEVASVCNLRSRQAEKNGRHDRCSYLLRSAVCFLKNVPKGEYAPHIFEHALRAIAHVDVLFIGEREVANVPHGHVTYSHD